MEVAGRVDELVDERWQPQGDAERGGNAESKQRVAPGCAVNVPNPKSQRHYDERAEPGDQAYVRDVGLRAQRSGEDRDGQHHEVVAEHRPHRKEKYEPPQERHVRRPRLGERRGTVCAQQHGQ